MISKFSEDCIKPIIPVKLGNMTIKALVDSGADFTMLRITDEFKSLLEMQDLISNTGEVIDVSGAGSFGSIPCFIYLVKSLEIGNFHFDNIKCLVMNNPHPECDLYLGLNILEKFNYAIDNKNKQVNMELIQDL